MSITHSLISKNPTDSIKGRGLYCSRELVTVRSLMHAVELLEDKVPLHAVIGGFHLVGEEQEANVPNIVKDFKALNLDVLLPGHCSG